MTDAHMQTRQAGLSAHGLLVEALQCRGQNRKIGLKLRLLALPSFRWDRGVPPHIRRGLDNWNQRCRRRRLGWIRLQLHRQSLNLPDGKSPAGDLSLGCIKFALGRVELGPALCWVEFHEEIARMNIRSRLDMDGSELARIDGFNDFGVP